MSDPVARLNAALEGRYTIERELGEGGMATVYLADDLKHERKVALKVLKPELAAVVGAERFLAEIKTTANLQHPHILPLHDSGEADGFLYYVMPYVEGETLGDRLERESQLPVDEAVKIATEIADALQAAHEQGVIHRDIKPANILLSRGRPLVADFGIALAVSAAGGGRLTETGLSLGTPHYMSPEQATGDQIVGPSTDIYALGSVLYEMLVGEPPYTGSNAQAILGKIIQGKPVSAREERAAVPVNVDAALRKALEKLPADRFTSAQEFARALGDEHFRYGEAVAGVAGAAPGPWNRLAVGLATLTVLLSLAATWGWLRPPTIPALNTAAPTLRFPLSEFRLAADVGSDRRLAISPDGSRIVLASHQDGMSRLFMRLGNEVGFTEVPNTERAAQPTFSPDGEWLAFVVEPEEIRRVGLSGDRMVSVATGTEPHWGVEDMLVFSRGHGIYRIAVAGGEPTLVLESEDISQGAIRPYLLPDGRAILFQGPGDIDTRRLMLVDIGSGAVTDLGIVGSNPRYVPTGHVVYGHSSQSLMAVPFDLATHRVTGAPSIVLPEVLVFNGGATQFSVSETGTAVVGLPAVGAQDRALAIVAFDGSESPLPFLGSFNHPRFSPPDGRRIAYESGRQIGVYDRVTGAIDFLTNANNYQSPWWSRDGRYVYYSGYVGVTHYDGVRRLADASEEEEVLYERDGDDFPLALSLDRKLLLVEVTTPDRGRDMMLVTQDAGSAVFSDYLRANWNETSGTLSPDGRWLAYVSDESGIPEVYVRSFPEADGQQVISSDGGTQPLWAPDGSAIYFRDGSRVIRAAVTVDKTLSVGSLNVLFEAEWMADALGRHDWDIHPNGESFVAVMGPTTEETEVDGVPIIPVQIIVNFFEELKRLVPN